MELSCYARPTNGTPLEVDRLQTRELVRPTPRQQASKDAPYEQVTLVHSLHVELAAIIRQPLHSLDLLTRASAPAMPAVPGGRI